MSENQMENTANREQAFLNSPELANEGSELAVGAWISTGEGVTQQEAAELMARDFVALLHKQGVNAMSGYIVGAVKQLLEIAQPPKSVTTVGGDKEAV